MSFEATIGLEIHVQLGTETKAFSASKVKYGAPPNSLTDPTVLGLPGALPSYNQGAFERALKLGLACGCHIREVSRFARKHYFYPDSPKGYQITQDKEPLCEGGNIEFLFEGKVHKVPLTRIHLEEDAGKSSHVKGAGSRVDLNRAGVPLCEIVTEPAILSSKEAAETMRAIRRLVRTIGISEGDLEKGHIRCDANVSIRPKGQKELGTRTEMKNINSFRFVEQAIDSEILRQSELLSQGGVVEQQTRNWDPDKGISTVMRSKEDAEDYRYFPDPDLPPLIVSKEMKEKTGASLPMLPVPRYLKYVDEYGLTEETAQFFVDENDVGQFFDSTAKHLASSEAKTAANWIQRDLMAQLKENEMEITESKISEKDLSDLVKLISKGDISNKIAKKVFLAMWSEGKSPKTVVEEQGLAQVSDEASIEKWVDEVIAANAKQVSEYRSGKTGLLGYFVGQVMKKSKGQANPGLVNKTLVAKLG